jgi:hypothetical protein
VKLGHEAPSRRGLPAVLAALLAPAIVLAAGTAGIPDRDERSAGLRIYRDGVLPSGAPLKGVAQAGVERVGPDAACEGCHRRSGYGTSEGPIVVRPITGPALFGPGQPGAGVAAAPSATATADPGGAAPAASPAARRAAIAARIGSPRRPSYDEATVARAIRDGVDMEGRPLAAGMPRYALGDDEMKALVAYLKTLSTEPSPGVGREEIHFATVVQPGVAPAKRRAMLDVLEAFVQEKNGGTRAEARRGEVGLKRMYWGYRRWVLHVWELSGSADGWGRQLEAFYERQPVFALVAGLGTTSWRPIHEFSERLGVPCLFPQVDLPALSGPGFYTVYLSKGISLEAEALARHLADRAGLGQVRQVFRRDAASATAAAAFREAMRARGVAVEDRVLDRAPTRSSWKQLADAAQASVLVLWLREGDLRDAGALLDAGSRVEAVYLSATLVGDRPALAAGRGGRVRMVYPLDLPRSRAARLVRVERWLEKKGMALSDEQVQVNANFAIAVTADVVTHMSDLFSREVLVERIEHMVGNTVIPSVYPNVSLGPGQRFASKGSYVVAVGSAGDGELEPLSDWITP